MQLPVASAPLPQCVARRAKRRSKFMIASRYVATSALFALLGCGGGVSDHAAGGSSEAAGVGGIFGAAPAEPLPQRLKLVTWNLEWLSRNNNTGPVKRDDDDYARLRGYAERLAADVIAFQEVDGSEAAARVFDPSQYQLHVAAQSDAQRTGFAIRKGVRLAVQPDYQALDVGQVRTGADIIVEFAGGRVRLLSVHLKSSCFDDPPTSTKRDCHKLFAQLPVLEAWIDARSREHMPAIVLGDFNRRLFGKPDEPFWHELDDADPPDSDLWSPTEGQRSTCWNGAYPQFIDHLVFNKPATVLADRETFEQVQYDPRDQQYKGVLSDHCPLAITLSHASAGQVLSARARRVDAGSQPQAKPEARIKGNINRGKKLYHTPGCRDYASTHIDEAHGERWFDTPRQAEAAGWTRSPSCP